MYADIAIDVPLDTLFTYRVPARLEPDVRRGARVLVPFGRKTAVGFCLNVKDVLTAGMESSGIKEIAAADTQPELSEHYLKWLEFAADHYACPPGQVFAQAIPPAYFETKTFGEPVVKKSRRRADKTPPDTPLTVLTPAQAAVVAAIEQERGAFFPVLLHGITGSGKTEIYIELIAKALERGRSALYLVPEIGLTPQTFSRLLKRFPGRLIAYHSGLTPNERLGIWQRAAREPFVVVGTRSALFMPFASPGLVIVDEEHDSSYKQEDRFRYHARDLAVARARFENVPVILGSATPSLESYHLARLEKYRYFRLTERAGGGALPSVETVDVAKEKEQTGLPLNLSMNVVRELGKCVADGTQAIVFVGQRGFAQSAYCRECRSAQTCPNCSVALKFHSQGALKCHYCGLDKSFDGICTTCGKKALTLVGFGIQSVEDELRTHFPKARILRVDSDAFPSSQKLESALTEFAAGKIDIVVGTQMMSKGHDFPGVRFVAVAGIDAHLGLPDFRSAERAFQTIVQVAGRAGRAGGGGRVLVQSFFPQHPSVVAGCSHDYELFAARELVLRKTLNYPPFSRLIQIRFASPSEAALRDLFAAWEPDRLRITAGIAANGGTLLGPSEMPLAKLRGKHRFHLLLKLPRKTKPRDAVNFVLASFARLKTRPVQIQVDVDPVGLL